MGVTWASRSKKSSFSRQQCGVILSTKDAHKNLGTKLSFGDSVMETELTVFTANFSHQTPWMLFPYLWSATPSVKHTVRLAGVVQAPR